MDLPVAIRQAIDDSLDGVGFADLGRASAVLSDRYRGEVSDGRPHLFTDLAARAYLAVRLPATYAAVRASFAAVAAVRPGFAPGSLADFGAGPGTALFAAADCWPGLEQATLVEGSNAIRRLGERLAPVSGVPDIAWRTADIAMDAPELPPADLVTLAYVLGELPAGRRLGLVERLWRLTADTLVVVEPGTPAGYGRIVAARAALLKAGAHIVAPCPHALACPLAPPDWCHFSQRLARSRLHRQAKGAAIGFEDEKFTFIAVSRSPADLPASRVIARPRPASGRVLLKLCQRDGTAAERLFSRRDGETWRQARRAGWGDALA